MCRCRCMQRQNHTRPQNTIKQYPARPPALKTGKCAPNTSVRMARAVSRPLRIPVPDAPPDTTPPAPANRSGAQTESPRPGRPPETRPLPGGPSTRGAASGGASSQCRTASAVTGQFPAVFLSTFPQAQQSPEAVRLSCQGCCRELKPGVSSSSPLPGHLTPQGVIRTHGAYRRTKRQLSQPA